MKKRTIMIAGCGRFGARLASQLSADGYYVVVIDLDKRAFRRLSERFCGRMLEGDATDTTLLHEACAEQAAYVVATTGSDNINCMIALIAKKIYHTEHVFARLYDDKKECLLASCGIQVIYPELLFASEFERLSHIQYQLAAEG